MAGGARPPRGRGRPDVAGPRTLPRHCPPLSHRWLRGRHPRHRRPGCPRALDVYASLPDGRGRPRIEHIETAPDTTVARFSPQQVTASMQPIHLRWMKPDLSDPWSQRLGTHRCAHTMRSGDLSAARALVVLGSDWPVAPFDPRLGFFAAQPQAGARPGGRGSDRGQPPALRARDAGRIHHQCRHRDRGRAGGRHLAPRLPGRPGRLGRGPRRLSSRCGRAAGPGHRRGRPCCLSRGMSGAGCATVTPHVFRQRAEPRLTRGWQRQQGETASPLTYLGLVFSAMVRPPLGARTLPGT